VVHSWKQERKTFPTSLGEHDGSAGVFRDGKGIWLGWDMSGRQSGLCRCRTGEFKQSSTVASQQRRADVVFS
jgi:hypothetical protein